ncbi:hypothetical protein [Pyrococcus yayanosii]|uniref:Uncharacterized protein n=1 Tax=Pyrococcus yayanosii (strain CH1 / JCM 16557) TaxID=529709 RepID=F8AIB9_PYRYC|nr:hypothetical protein [Pyrococcus yayanosii]AEH25522.1 hypothetical protein PYCH_18670 [Pyrococcus yayanosii CH1]
MLVARPCTSMGGILVQLYLWEDVKIDLKKVAQKLKERGYQVKTLIPGIMLIAVIDGFNVSVYPSGKIIIKDLKDTKEGERIARIIYELAGVRVED